MSEKAQGRGGMTMQLLLTLLMQQGRVAVGGFVPSCRFFFEKRGWIDSFENRGAGEAGKLMEQGLLQHGGETSV